MQINKSVHLILILFLFMSGVIVWISHPLARQNNQESQSFLELMAETSGKKVNPIKLNDITMFEWDRVCSLGADDSESDSIKNWVYLKFPNHNKLQISAHAERALIFFHRNNPVKLLLFEYASFESNKGKIIFYAVDEDGDDIGESCIDKKSAYIKYLSKDNILSFTLYDHQIGNHQ